MNAIKLLVGFATYLVAVNGVAFLFLNSNSLTVKLLGGIFFIHNIAFSPYVVLIGKHIVMENSSKKTKRLKEDVKDIINTISNKKKTSE